MEGADHAAVYEKYADELIRFASTLVGPSGAEDLLSSVFVKAMGSPGWDRVKNKRAYLFRAVTNEARSRHRATQRRLAREACVAGPEAVEAEATPRLAGDPDLLRAMRRLTVRQRAVIWMAYWLDAEANEIARMLDVSQRTVERELQRARKRLEQELT